MIDPLDSLLDTLDILDGTSRKLWHECRDASGVVMGIHPLAVSPRDAAGVADWEARSIAMHSEQTTVIPEPKPAPQSIIGGIKRTAHVVDDPIQIFADLPEAQRRALLKRGD